MDKAKLEQISRLVNQIKELISEDDVIAISITATPELGETYVHLTHAGFNETCKTFTRRALNSIYDELSAEVSGVNVFCLVRNGAY